MRRIIFLALGVLEIGAAGVLFAFVWQLPGPADVHDKVGRIERVSRQTSTQVRNLRHQVHILREGQPQARLLAQELKERLRYLGEHLNSQHVDYHSLRALHDAFGDAAQGLDVLSSEPVAPDGFAQIAMALAFTADFLNAVQVRDMARLLRSGTEGLGRTAARWPEMRKNLRDSAELMRDTQKQLRVVLDNRPSYEASLRQSRTVVEGLSAAVPMYTDQWGKDLADQERALAKLGTSIDDLSSVMPEVQAVGSRLMVMTRLLLSLLGAIFLLHGGYLAINFWMRQ